MEKTTNLTGGRRPFSDFYKFLDTTGISQADEETAAVALNEIEQQFCGGDEDQLAALVSEVGGANVLNRLWIASERNVKTMTTLLEICQRYFKSDVSTCLGFARSVGGPDNMLQLIKTSTTKHFFELKEAFSENELKDLDFDDLHDEGKIEEKHESALDSFLADPSDDTLLTVVKFRLIRSGDVVNIAVLDRGEKGKGEKGEKAEKALGTMMVDISTSGATSGDVMVQALCEVPEQKAGTVKIQDVALLVNGKRFVPRNRQLIGRLADPKLIWIAWLNMVRENSDESVKRKDLVALDFVKLAKLSLITDGEYTVYQTDGDATESAKLDEELMCFSFSCGIISKNRSVNIIGLWVLHVHCQEVAIKDGKCLRFKMLAASLKKQEEDRKTGSSNTLKIDLGELSKKGTRGKEREGKKELMQLMAPVTDLLKTCDSDKVLGLWNLERERLLLGARHDTIYERHNVASPEDDLHGWFKTLLHDRIPFCFQSAEGSHTHVGAVQDELKRLGKFLEGKSQEERKEYRWMLDKVAVALRRVAEETKSIKRSVRGTDLEEREIPVDPNFNFTEELVVAGLGRITIKRTDRQNGRGKTVDVKLNYFG
jgi:hypothetical protein